MKDNKNNIRVLEILGVLFFLLTQITVFANNLIYFERIKTGLIISAIIISAIAVLIRLRETSNSIKKLIAWLFLTIIGIASYFFHDNTLLVCIPLTIPFVIYEKPKRIARSDMLAKIIIVLFVVINHLVGLTQTMEISRNGLVRTSLGFRHPNTLGFMLVTILIDSILICKNKKKCAMAVGFGCLAIACMADSRTAIVAIISIIVTTICNECFGGGRKNANKISKYMPVLMLAISIYATYAYMHNSPRFIEMNTLLSGRLWLQAYYYSHYKISLFGQKIVFGKMPLDNGYYHLLYSNGLIGLMAVILCGAFSIKNAQQRDKNLSFIIGILLVYGMMETIALNVAAAPTLLYCFAKIGSDKENKK